MRNAPKTPRLARYRVPPPCACADCRQLSAAWRADFQARSQELLADQIRASLTANSVTVQAVNRQRDLHRS